jgi:hypothetical protein
MSCVCVYKKKKKKKKEKEKSPCENSSVLSSYMLMNGHPFLVKQICFSFTFSMPGEGVNERWISFVIP